MRLNRWLLSGACLSCLPMTSLFAVPQTDDLRVITVVQTQSGDDEPAKTEGQERSRAKTETVVPKIWLGIGLKEIEGDLATYLGSSEGVFIESVFPDSPAEAAKLQQGDIVMAFEGKKVAGPAELVDALHAVKANDASEKEDAKPASYPNVTLTISRRGQEMKVEMKPIERPQSLRVSAKNDPDDLLLQGANIFRFGQPADATIHANPHTVFKSNVVIVVKEGDQEYIARVERDGQGAAKIIVTHNKEDRELSEDQLDQLPEKVQQAIKKALKAHTVPELKWHKSESNKGPQGSSKAQSLEEMTEALKQVGGGEFKIELHGLPGALGNIENGRAIVIDAEKLKGDVEKRKGVWEMKKHKLEVDLLKVQVEDLKNQVEELREELRASKK